MSHKTDTPIYNNSNEDLVVDGVTIAPFSTELVDTSHSATKKGLENNAGRWQSEPFGGPFGIPEWAVGPTIDNRIIVDIQLKGRVGKKWHKFAGIGVAFTNNSDGTGPNANTSIVSTHAGVELRPGLYKTTRDGRLSFEVENTEGEDVYMTLYLGGKEVAISPLLDFSVSAPAPTFISFTSPAPHTLKLVGTGFAAAEQFLTGHTNGNIYAAKPGTEGADDVNNGNGVTITTWDDNVIEFTSPYIPTGTILAVVLQGAAPERATLGEWLNSNLASGGFAPFAVQGPAPVITNVYDDDTTIFIEGEGLSKSTNTNAVFMMNEAQNKFAIFGNASWHDRGDALITLPVAQVPSASSQGLTWEEVEYVQMVNPNDPFSPLASFDMDDSNPPPAPGPSITSVQKTGATEVTINGTGLDVPEFVMYMIDQSKPHTGVAIRYPTDMMTVTPTSIVADFNDFTGNSITGVVLEDANQSPIIPTFTLNTPLSFQPQPPAAFNVSIEPGCRIVVDKADGGLSEVEMVQVWWNEWSYQQGWSESTGLVPYNDNFVTHTDTQIVVDLPDYYSGTPLYAIGLVDNQGTRAYITGGDPIVLEGVYL